MNTYARFMFRRSALPALLAFALLAWARPAAAVQLADLYTAEVPYDAARRDARALAYERALSVVLRRITPQSGAADAAVALGNPGDYVLGFREGAADSLWVSFDGVTISARLREAGLPVWGSDRPLTLVWLALDARNEGRLLVSANAPEQPPEVAQPLVLAPQADPAAVFRVALADASEHYGVPLSFPLLDDRDLAAVTPSDVWGGFEEVLLAASARYGTTSVLLGRADASRPEVVRWTWLFAGESSDFGGSMDAAARRLSSELMAAFASSPDASVGVRVSVVGITDMLAYARVNRFLGSQSLIEHVGVDRMQGDEVTFVVDSLTTRERLASMLDGATLELLPQTPIETMGLSRPLDPQAPDLVYRLRAAGGSAR